MDLELDLEWKFHDILPVSITKTNLHNV